ncbi:MAG: GDP-mannose 4,6-dehydratase, partial [Ilumatobacteraceae bacterium]
MTTTAITGSEGFIASHLVETLVRRGHSVRAMVQYNSFSSAGWLDQLPAEVLDHVEIFMGDVRDHRSVMELTEGVDAICHLAALIAIPYS